MDPERDTGGQGQEVVAVLAGVGCHAAQGAFLEQVALVVEGRDVGEVDARDREGATSVQGGQGVRHQAADRGEEDGGVEGFGDASVPSPAETAPSSSASRRAEAARVTTWTRAPAAIATWPSGGPRPRIRKCPDARLREGGPAGGPGTR